MASASARGSLRSEKQAAVRSSGVNSQLRSKIPFSKRSVAPSSKPSSADEDNSVSGRVRVAVRLRPRNAEDLASDADFADFIELQPELKRLKLLKNNWSSESYKFDEVFTESASQRRVYEVVAKPVVESVLDGYNGTVMAYGQTGTGKTYTVARLGKDDPSERGIMVRALEDIFAATSPTSDTVAISYLQLYLEAIQDLLVPEKNNIPIVEDPKTGEVSLPGAEIIKVRDLDHFTKLLEIGEANRHAANTKLNTESSRSHAILSVYIQRSAKGKGEEGAPYLEKDGRCDLPGGNDIPTVLRSKLLVVDLAGSERIDKSGSEGHTLEEAKFINLSLSSLGKCINALAENSPHIPIRDSKLTRLLRDSFGGSARTSLIITIGPSVRHHAETTGTIMFGQRAMKIVNMLKLKEEFDYESLCRKLVHQVDHLTAEIERQQKLRDDDNKQMEKKLEEYEKSLLIAEKSISTKYELLEKDYSRLELELNSAMDELNLHKGQNDRMHDEVARLELSLKQTKQHQLDGYAYQKILTDTTQMYEKKIAELMEQIEYENCRFKSAQEELEAMNKILSDQQRSLQLQAQREKDELEVQLQEVCVLHEKGVNELQFLKTEKEELISEKAMLYEELLIVQKKLSNEVKQRKCLEDELFKWKKHVSENNIDLEARNSCMKDEFGRVATGLISSIGLHKSNQSKENLSSGQRVSLQKLLASLKCKDEDAQIHAVKLVANLAAEDSNQEKIVVEGGLDSLLTLLGSSQNTTIHRVASGAIANLAMNEVNQGLIVSKGGVRLLADIASETDDPPTLRMVAGAVANLCGNERLHTVLIDDGGTKALMEMVRCGHSEVIAQIARGMANFAKCESRGITQGRRKGRSILIADGALKWMVSNSTCIMDSTRRHIELALCHLAQNEDNAEDFISSGALRELIRISRESTKEDIRLLAKKILNKSAIFLAEIQRDWQQL